MSDSASRSDLMAAMTTEHFVLQTSLSTTGSEGAARASLYVYALSSALVAMGFISRTEVFLPFVAAVLPAIFLMGMFTVLRLVDIAMEGIRTLYGIARIRAFYRSLGQEAAAQFHADFGRWPEGKAWPALRIGPVIGVLTTAASMIACVNAFVAGVGVTLLIHQLTGAGLIAAAAMGGACTVALVIGFYLYQDYRIEDASKTSRALECGAERSAGAPDPRRSPGPRRPKGGRRVEGG